MSFDPEYIIECKKQSMFAYVIGFCDGRSFHAENLYKDRTDSKSYYYLSLIPLQPGDIAICLCAPMSTNHLSLGYVRHAVDPQVLRRNKTFGTETAATGLIIGKANCDTFQFGIRQQMNLTQVIKNINKQAKKARATIPLPTLMAYDEQLMGMIHAAKREFGESAVEHAMITYRES